MTSRRALLHVCLAVVAVNGALWGTDASYRKWVVKPRIRAQEYARLLAKESELRKELLLLRSAITLYTAENHHPPQSLKQLVIDGYLVKIPPDPITGTTATWRAIKGYRGNSCFFPNEDVASLVFGYGMVDVRSGSDAIDSTGTRVYLEW